MSYVNDAYEAVVARNPLEPEFCRPSAKYSLHFAPVFDQRPSWPKPRSSKSASLSRNARSSSAWCGAMMRARCR